MGLFKRDPQKKLRKQYEQKLKEAMELQRSGDIKGYAAAMGAADKLEKELIKVSEGE